MTTVSLALRGGLALAFTVAGASKLRHRRSFRSLIARYQIVPERWLASIAAAITAAELALGALLAAGLFTRAAAAATAALVAVFSASTVYALWRGRDPDCGCFRAGTVRPAGPLDVARNLALAGAAAFVATRPSQPLSLDALRAGDAALRARDLVAAAAGVSGCAVALLWRDLERRRHRIVFPSALGRGVLGTSPQFSVRGPSGIVEAPALVHDGALLLFMEGGCAPCVDLARELSGSDGTVAGFPLHVIAGDLERAQELALPPSIRVWSQHDRAASNALQQLATPQAYAIAADGLVVGVAVPASPADLVRLASALTSTQNGGGALRSAGSAPSTPKSPQPS
jgi:uncharacterized membrane protein YphA (DoxX/SURF4 family)